MKEPDREDFRYVVPDFRLNKALDQMGHTVADSRRIRWSFCVTNVAGLGVRTGKHCYETVSRKNLGEEQGASLRCSRCHDQGYRFSKAMKNPGFIGIDAIQNVYLPMGFSNFKIEGRGLGSALILEFLLYYMTKPEYQLYVREEIYLDNMLDLF